MNDKLIAGMPEVLRLTQAGRLQEATSAIQRMLAGQRLAPVATEPATSTGRDPIEGVFRVMNEEPLHAARPAEAPQPQIIPGRMPDGIPRGQFITGSYTNQAGSRPYKLYIPGGYRGQALPLVVMLHGCTQNPDDFAAGTRMNQVAEEQQCFVLYPAQVQSANPSKCWNWFKQSDQQRDRGEPSIIAGMTRQIMSSHSVDPRRVYVAGLSAGGAMAVTLGMTYPEVYAAIGVHSGLAYAAARDVPSAFAAMRQSSAANGRMGTGAAGESTMYDVPTIVFHGDRDTTVHPCNGDQVIAQSRGVGANTNSDTSAGVSDRATVQRGQVAQGHAYTRTVYHDAGGQAIVEHWLVHGAGHTWSGGSVNGSFTDPKGPDATQEMIRFFREHPQLTRH
ncbi:MAG: extracellular catalytic domain type 1 short-chain-length polyhydroxyalkanoate depolymerase [Gammaproteobacteria bacterium]